MPRLGRVIVLVLLSVAGSFGCAGRSAVTGETAAAVSSPDTLTREQRSEPPEPAATWGMKRWVHSRTNVRSARTTDSRIVGKLETGDSVKVDFHQDDWYAVFQLNQEVRAESLATGYVYAPLLKSNLPPKPQHSSTRRHSGGARATGSGLTYSQMMDYLDQFFVMERSTPVDGQPRYLGQSTNGLAIIELIGSRDNLTRATLMVGIPSDNPAVLAENSAILLRFAKNADPTWTGSSDWVTSSIESIQRTASKTRRTYRGRIALELELLEPLGILYLSIEPR